MNLTMQIEDWPEQESLLVKLKATVLGFRFGVHRAITRMAIERAITRMAIERATEPDLLCQIVVQEVAAELREYVAARIQPRSAYWREQLGADDGATP